MATHKLEVLKRYPHATALRIRENDGRLHWHVFTNPFLEIDLSHDGNSKPSNGSAASAWASAAYNAVSNTREDAEITRERIYTDKGYKNRADYLQQLADEYDVPIKTVRVIADLFGPDEDFDGLVTAIQDAKDFL